MKRNDWIEFRREFKLSQRDFADELGIKRSTYSCWELGIRKPSARMDNLIYRTIARYKVAGGFNKELTKKEKLLTGKRKIKYVFLVTIILILLMILY